jgi:hypothetical protein
MQKRASQVLVGDLLVNSELVSLTQLADAMPVALKTGVPVGRVLIASGFLSEEIFRQVLSVQSLVRDRLISEVKATEALKLIKAESLDLNSALKKLGIESEYFNSANRLGEILISAGAIDSNTLDEALTSSYTTGLQLARVLSLRGFVREQIAFVSLIGQSLVRDFRLTRDQAVAGIKAVNSVPGSQRNGILINSSLTARKANSMRLGELLLLSGMVDQVQLLSALDKGIAEEQPLGRILVRMEALSEVELNQALTLQDMINNGSINASDATYVLSRVKASGVSLSKALSQEDQAKNDSKTITYDQFLVASGLASSADDRDPFDEEFTTFIKATFDQLLKKRLNDEQCAYLVQLESVKQKKEDLEEVLKSLNW